MANDYKYGVYGYVGTTVAQNAVQAGTIPVYIGTAPINLVRGYDGLGVVNTPIKITNWSDAQKKMGYSSDWDKFTLCEAFYAHFNNPIGNIGPIYVINVLDPSAMRAEKPTTKQIIFNAGTAEFKSDTIILDTILLEGFVEGKDFTIDYNYTRNTIIINKIDGGKPLTGSIPITYFDVDISKITENHIIGGKTANGEYSGLGALDLLYGEHNAVANIISAPKWSSNIKVYNAMLSASQKINGHWDAFVIADIPLENESVKNDTIDKAITWRKNNGFGNERSKVYWPMALDNAGNRFHLSTLAVATMQRVDFSHDSVPMETPGNKKAPITKLFFGEESKNRGYDQQTANQLTQNGIATAVYWGGQWVLWGDHTSAYTYGADVDPRAIFDTSIRMLMYITNSFQREWGTTVDKPIDRQLVDTIINREQEKLDVLVAKGALLGNPKIEFIESENPTTDIMNGDFRWDIQATPTPPLKSATVYVAYTDKGFSSYFEEVE